MQNLSFIHRVEIAAYFGVVQAIAWWATTRKKEVSSDYFLAGRDAGWSAVGARLFVSNIGSEHLVALAGSGAAGGFAVGHFEWLASLILLLPGWLFAPFYLRSDVRIAPQSPSTVSSRRPAAVALRPRWQVAAHLCRG